MRIEETVSESEMQTMESTLNQMDPIPNVKKNIDERKSNGNKHSSIVWDYFDKEQAYIKKGLKYLKCNKVGCNAEIQYNPGTTSNLKRHVDKLHQNLSCSNNTDIRQLVMSHNGTKVIPPFSQHHLMDYLIRLFVNQDLPFRLLESEEFRDVVQLLNSNAKLVMADQFKKGIMEKFKEKKLEMTATLASIDSRISFTMDVWTAPNDLAFMAITGHWISLDFKPQSVLMDFVQLLECHTGKYIEEAFTKSLQDYRVLECGITVRSLTRN